ncbi:unnamed protein product [Parnassius apollo]|uniref:(apollo) hypothetical protein n=1 Tax=Parnassius apollo TaxID=110799 RepID=A0A8S3XTV0_PARAO|nr:unnamed protein product [Parnassius apollo]
MCWSEHSEASKVKLLKADLAHSSPVSWRACCPRSEPLAHLVLVGARRYQCCGEQVAQQARLGAQLARQLARVLLQE